MGAAVSCDKVRFNNEDQARNALRSCRIAQRRRRKRQRHEARAYRCPLCQGWHLTSKDR